MSPIDVSVVIPVYNSGPAIDSCIASLLAQSLPAQRLQIIFSDDGSTDGTGEKLDRLAAEHSHVEVIHSPNSGWPGRPRNLGIDAAKGEYIQFVDHDDSLAPDALELLVAYGRANDADIVIGRVTSNFRPTPNELFRQNHPVCTISDSRLIDSLTPHKMFRREFLTRTGIRYPEGKVRLEDQLFMMKTYFAGSTVSVLSEFPCYFYSRRPEGEHAASEDVDPRVYYGYLREVLDVIEAGTEPGEFRDELYRRFYRTMIRRTASRLMSGRPAQYVDAYVESVTSINTDYFSDGVTQGLPPLRRAQGMALAAGRLDQLVGITERSSAAKPDVQLDEMTWTGSAWRMAVTLRMLHPDGSPVVVVPSGDGYRLDPRIVPDEIDVRPDSRAELLANARADIVLRERQSGMRWYAPGELAARLEPVAGGVAGALDLVYSGEVEIDPLTMALGHPLTQGIWDVAVHYEVFGLWRAPAVGPKRSPAVQPTPILVRPPGRVVRPNINQKGRLALFVQPPAKSVSAVMARYVDRIDLSGRMLTASVGIDLVGDTAPMPCQVSVGVAGKPLPATITAAAGGAELRCDLGPADLPRGRHTLLLQAGSDDRPEELGTLSVGRLGRIAATPRD